MRGADNIERDREIVRLEIDWLGIFKSNAIDLGRGDNYRIGDPALCVRFFVGREHLVVCSVTGSKPHRFVELIYRGRLAYNGIKVFLARTSSRIT